MNLSYCYLLGYQWLGGKLLLYSLLEFSKIVWVWNLMGWPPQLEFFFLYVEDAQSRALRWVTAQHVNCLYMQWSYPCLSSIQFYTARTVLPLESVVSVLACIMKATGNSSNGRCQATYFYLSTSGLVGKWLYDHYLKLSTILCVSTWMGDRHS